MGKEKVISVAEKAKASAMAFIGICFFSIGTTYFEERLVYRLPRIFIPILELFGNVALAIAMLVLGLAFIYWGYAKWKKFSDKSATFLILSAVGLLVGVVLAIGADFYKSDPDKIMDNIEQRRQEQIDEIKNSGELNFQNENVDKHVAAFDSIYKKYEQETRGGNEAGIQECWEKYMKWTEGTADLMEELDVDQKVELARYLAKLAIKWSEVK